MLKESTKIRFSYGLTYKLVSSPSPVPHHNIQIREQGAKKSLSVESNSSIKQITINFCLY